MFLRSVNPKQPNSRFLSRICQTKVKFWATQKQAVAAIVPFEACLNYLLLLSLHETALRVIRILILSFSTESLIGLPLAAANW
ncbi:hypothetical protein L3X38_008814 [Prunus dulcis]|uniref:Uncharacterized protein n=1 Tax=Prunus dulcis TaxID=3755 RepID=A0AAD4ZX85_PRUDU|nr:hypothetical protein L3X38_008814 [Prunus dulcis]